MLIKLKKILFSISLLLSFYKIKIIKKSLVKYKIISYKQYQGVYYVNCKIQSVISGFTPVVNTREGEFAYHVDADLPGVKKEDIKVSVKGNMITISGERHDKKETNEKDYHRIETSFGKFERSFTLPDGVDIENITASNEDGVLEVVIPKLKTETEKVKKIEVK